MLTNRKRYLKELTNEQYYFIEKRLEKANVINIIQYFKNCFGCWITYKRVIAVSEYSGIKVSLSFGAKVNQILMNYYGRINNDQICSLLNDKFCIGIAPKELDSYCATYLGLDKVKNLKTKNYYDLIDVDTKNKVMSGTAKDIGEFLNVNKNHVYASIASNSFLEKEGKKYSVMQVKLYGN